MNKTFQTIAILLSLFLLAAKTNGSELDSVTLKNVKIMERGIMQTAQKVDSLSNEISRLQIKEDSFSDILSAQTAIFTVIISIIISLITLVSWRSINEKIKQNNKNLINRVAEVDRLISDFRIDFLKSKRDLDGQSANISKLMARQALASGDNLAHVRWSFNSAKHFYSVAAMLDIHPGLNPDQRDYYHITLHYITVARNLFSNYYSIDTRTEQLKTEVRRIMTPQFNEAIQKMCTCSNDLVKRQALLLNSNIIEYLNQD